jgi:hypothetical protein
MSFVESVAAGLVAAAILAVVAAVRARRPLSTVRLGVTVAPRMRRAGVSNIFASRAEYVRNRTPSSATEYMGTAKHEVVYVGFWLAQAGEIEPLHRALRSLLDRSVRVTLVLLDAELPEAQCERVAAVLDLSAAGLRDRLQNAWGDLMAFRRGLPANVASRLTLRGHGEHLQASAFIFDRGHPTAKTLVDFKLYGMGRQDSFGIELRPPKRDSEVSLYARATRSFELISERADAVDD